jgi:hypothetical protein
VVIHDDAHQEKLAVVQMRVARSARAVRHLRRRNTAVLSLGQRRGLVRAAVAAAACGEEKTRRRVSDEEGERVGRRTTVVRSDDLTWGLHWTTSAKYDAKVRGKRRARVLVARTHLNPLRPRLDSTARRSDLLVEARRPRVWRREEPGAARRLGDDDERHFSGRLVDRRDWRLGLESSALRENDKKGPFAKATRFAGADAAVRSHGRDG